MSEGGKRRLAAIVIADVVGYSRLVGADEIGALALTSQARKFPVPVSRMDSMAQGQ